MVYKDDFEIKELPITDKELNLDITLYAKGIVEFSSDADDVNIENSKQSLLSAIVMAVKSFAENGDGYDTISRKVLLPDANNIPAKLDETDGSIELNKIYFTEIHPIDTDFPRIIKARKEISAKPKPETSCGTLNPAILSDETSGEQNGRSRFCHNCGLNLLTRPAGIRFCPKCGCNLGAVN